MKAFVTGSTGLLGTNLVKELLKAGYEVTGLVRSRSKGERVIGDPRVTLIEGDMEDVDRFASHLRGCDVLFHTAAYFREYFQPGDHWATLMKINVEGTLQLLEAAEAGGINKAIYVSSSTVIGESLDGRISDETTPPDRHVEQNLYARSKVEAEKAIAKFLKTHTLPVVLILPTWMFGPYDNAPTSSGQMVKDFLTHRLPGIPPGGAMIADARDVALGMIQAVEYGRSGERYVIGGEFYTLADVCHTLEKVSGIPAPRMQIPYPIAMGYAWFSETLARVRGTDTLITIAGIQTLNHQSRVSSGKAIRELGIHPRPLEDTLHDEVTFYRGQTS
jgi:dihydroflavonol-4-reductase